jgi:hypothetical protein
MSALAQLKLLVNLAQIDGAVDDPEKNFIINIGRANGLYPDEIMPLFDQKHDLIIPKNLTPDEQFRYLFSFVQLMKIDERMYKQEIIFCSKIATKLGYEQQVMFDLMLHVKAKDMSASEIEELKKITEKHRR